MMKKQPVVESYGCDK